MHRNWEGKGQKWWQFSLYVILEVFFSLIAILWWCIVKEQLHHYILFEKPLCSFEIYTMSPSVIDQWTIICEVQFFFKLGYYSICKSQHHRWFYYYIRPHIFKTCNVLTFQSLVSHKGPGAILWWSLKDKTNQYFTTWTFMKGFLPLIPTQAFWSVHVNGQASVMLYANTWNSTSSFCMDLDNMLAVATTVQQFYSNVRFILEYEIVLDS